MSHPGRRLEDVVAELEDKVNAIGDLLRDAMCAVAQPGDTVILAFEGGFTDEDIEHLGEAFEPLKEKGIEVAFTDQVRGVTVARPTICRYGCASAACGWDENINDWNDEDLYGPEDV